LSGNHTKPSIRIAPASYLLGDQTTSDKPNAGGEPPGPQARGGCTGLLGIYSDLDARKERTYFPHFASAIFPHFPAVG
jgi:hypothetical protein